MRAVFLRLLGAPEKAEALRRATRLSAGSASRLRFDEDPATFAVVPRSPFAYWVSARSRSVFTRIPALSEGFLATRGAYTTDDFRFYALWWEQAAVAVTHGEKEHGFVPLAKGGAWAPYYADVYLAIRWGRAGAEAKAFLSDYRERKGWGTDWSACLNGHDHYLRPGVTWSRRTQGGLSFRAMPSGAIFADKGPAVFVAGNDSQELLALMSVLNSRAFRALVDQQMAFGSYEVGVIQRTPVPALPATTRIALAGLSRRAWALRRSLDACTENSHAFCLPAILQAPAGTVVTRSVAWVARATAVDTEIASLQAEIDDYCFDLYGFNREERQEITEDVGGPVSSAVTEAGGAATETGSDPAGNARLLEDDSDPDACEESAAADATTLTVDLLSWSMGVAFGRFDLRLATGERAIPPEPGPFDPLPVCSPGMLAGADGLPCSTPPPGYPIDIPQDGVLLDDPGHTRDLTASARAVFDIVFAGDADARWQEAAGILDPKNHDLRAFVARTFFEQHLKRYSKSRRKAPIYWQLATLSASYSVWLYAHRLTADTFFHVLHDVVAPKLGLEERKLLSLTQESGPNPTASQRKEIAGQEAFVDELKAFRDEIARVAPLWKPDLEDGVVLTMAPLWRLVPQHRAWQKELKAAWDSLSAGEYDWAHVAMHLWPERVVPKCATDRSLAIAHVLEEVFWEENAKGKWVARCEPLRPTDELIRERTSPAVKAAISGMMGTAGPFSAIGPTRQRRAR